MQREHCTTSLYKSHILHLLADLWVLSAMGKMIHLIKMKIFKH